MTTSNLPHPQTYEAYRQAKSTKLPDHEARWSAYMVSPETTHETITTDVDAAEQKYQAEQPGNGG